MDIIEELLLQIKNIDSRKENLINFIQKCGYSECAENLENLSKAQKKNFDIGIASLKDLKLAVIMDSFTLESYRPECKLVELVPDDWKEQMEEFVPHMVFIESAWHGKDKLWYRKVDRYSKELDELSSYCHEKNIPVVFWNKEDPVHTSTFMITAALADFVFTTDIDCVKRYKVELGHDRVYHLHFAAQPNLHNPIEKYDRKDKFCFAGAYYHKYVKRAEVFDKFAKEFIKEKGFDIFDRNYQNALPEYAFPAYYDKYILGNLKPSEIDVAYKGYNYGINMNSVQNSQSMFARRVFELLASNTILVGNFARGIKNYFGDLTISTDQVETLRIMLDKYCQDQETLHKYRLLGLRKTLSEHLYEDRLDYIVETVFGKTLKKRQPLIVMLTKCENAKDVDRAFEVFSKQTYNNKKLVIIGEDLSCEQDKVFVYSPKKAGEMLVSTEDGEYYSYINLTDYYGVNYLKDLALNLRYSNFDGVGKNTYYSNDKGNIILRNSQDVYKKCSGLHLNRAIISGHLLADFSLKQICEMTKEWHSDNFISVDEFNYCENYEGTICQRVDDLNVSNQGLSLAEIEQCAESIEGTLVDESEQIVLNPEKWFSSIKSSKQVIFSRELAGITISSQLPEGKHEYCYLDEKIDISDVVKEGRIKIEFNVHGDLDCACVVLFLDKSGNKLQPQFPRANILTEVVLPANATYAQIGYRPKGAGKAQLGDVIFCNINTNGNGCFISNKKVLVLTNQYPSRESLYRNMFVHKRVKEYQDRNLLCEVMCFNSNLEECFREFEGIDIVQGSGEKLVEILDSNTIETVCVHFLDVEMWSILKLYLKQIKLNIWCHGSDIQPWWRRDYLYKTPEARKQGELATQEKMKLWNDVFKESMHNNIHFVFVSQYFADIVMEDYNIKFSEEQYSIIHNYIDSRLFQYNKKSPEQRKKIISVRPYASEVYANDISVATIVELSKRKCFKNMEFLIAGDGELFEKVTRPLRKYRNVSVQRAFYTQDRLSELYQEYGIVLIPSRGDTQGVSRDEAMSSGCVPITNPVMAIPEFVDDTCAFLVEPENYVKMADAIEKLYYEETLFEEMSENAARHVRELSSFEKTIDKEIELVTREI